MAKTTKKALGAAMAGVMAVGAVAGAVNAVEQVKVANAAESQAVKNAKAKISHLISSINKNYAGIKNQATWEGYVKEAKALIAKISSTESAQANALTLQVNGISDTIKAIARINQVEKSYEVNYKGIKNAAQWNEYLEEATTSLKSVDKSVFGAKYAELVERLNKAQENVKVIIDKHNDEIKRIEGEVEKAVKANDAKALQELLDNDIKKLGTHKTTEELKAKVETAIKEVKNKLAKSITAINATTVEVEFANKVEDVKSLKFSIEGLEVKNAAAKQTNDKVVVLTTAVQAGDKEYTVKLGEEVLGKFKGISAVIPDSIKAITTSVQGVVGKEVTLKANIGQKTAGVPVTFNVDADNNSLNKDIVAEVYTDANGDATFTYTQYNGEATADSVAVYATGNPSKRDFAKVYWGVEKQLTVTSGDDNKGTSLVNGEKKVYKVTYKDSKSGKGLANRTINVAFAENIGVTSDKLSTATVFDPSTGNTSTPYQLSNGSTKIATVKTDKDGVATFTVSGTNTKATPIVFVDNLNDKLDSTELQDVTDQVSFVGAQLNNSIEVTAEGTNHAAIGSNNGRVYTVTVKDKDGKAYANGTVNLGLNEELDKDISTNTKAYFVKYLDKDGDEAVGKLLSGTWKEAKNQLKLDKNGQAKFVLASDYDRDYGTPVIWIDQNESGNNQSGVLENGEPSKIGERTFFELSIVKSSQLKVYKNGKEYDKVFAGNETATFIYDALNQSGKPVTTSKEVTFEVVNNGAEPINVSSVGNSVVRVEAYGRTTVKVSGINSTVEVNSITGNDTSVTVSANGYELVNGQTKYLGHQIANAKFSKYATADVSTGTISSVNTTDKTFLVTDAAGKSFFYKYKDAAFQEKGQKISEAAFEALIKNVYAKVSVTKDSAGNYTFNVLETGTTVPGTPGTTVVDKLNNAGTVAAKEVIIAANYSELSAAQVTAFAGALNTLAGGTSITTTNLQSTYDGLFISVKSAQAVDSDNDGKADKLKITFTENVTAADKTAIDAKIAQFTLDNGTLSGTSTTEGTDTLVFAVSGATGLSLGNLKVAASTTANTNSQWIVGKTITLSAATYEASAAEGVTGSNSPTVGVDATYEEFTVTPVAATGNGTATLGFSASNVNGGTAIIIDLPVVSGKTAASIGGEFKAKIDANTAITDKFNVTLNATTGVLTFKSKTAGDYVVRPTASITGAATGAYASVTDADDATAELNTITFATATVVTKTGKVSVKVGSTTVDTIVTKDDTATVVANKVYDNLRANTSITTGYTVSIDGAKVILANKTKGNVTTTVVVTP